MASSARSDSALNAPPSGPAPAGVVRFIALGDMGTGSAEQYAVARQMTTYHDERPFDIVITLGDNIYPDGNPAHFISKFERPYAELLRRRVNFHASLGNHDVRRGRQAQMNYSHFNMGGRAYYSFTKGDDLVELFALDSTDPDAEQTQWLERTLAKSKARWKVAYFHHPIYSSGRTHGSDVRVRRQFEPLFVKYGIAAAISGHDHFYERTKPQMGIQYFVAGAGGKLRRGNIDWRSPLLAVGDDRSNTFMYFEVTRDQIGFWAVDVTGRIADSGAITGPQLTLKSERKPEPSQWDKRAAPKPAAFAP
jgi:3',5'-cyclic AMP phosphodiesterase CpdA